MSQSQILAGGIKKGDCIGYYFFLLNSVHALNVLFVFSMYLAYSQLYQ